MQTLTWALSFYFFFLVFPLQAKVNPQQELDFLFPSSLEKLDRSHRPASEIKARCQEKSYKVAAADGRIVIWATNAKGYSDRFVSHADYLQGNLDYLIQTMGYIDAVGGGLRGRK